MKLLYYIIPIIIFICCKKTEIEKPTNKASIINISLFDNPVKIDSTLLSSYNNPSLTAFYKKYNNETVWTTKEERIIVLNEIIKSSEDGLMPTDYNYNKLITFENKYNDLEDEKLVDYDLLLTQSLQKLVTHITNGKLSPREIYDNWDLKEKVIDVNQILFDAIDKNNFPEAFENCRPKHLVYQNLKSALKTLYSLPKDTLAIIELKSKDKILANKTHKSIKTIKARLMYWNDLKKNDSITNIYDKETQEALKLFQARHGLNPDGVIGKGTVLALNTTKLQREEQIIANLERWRWCASDFGKNYLLINIPDYTLLAINNNDTIQKQRIVVGKDTRMTPVLESKVTNINLNPNWTVPPTILKEDVFPDAIKSRTAFSKKNLIIVNYKNKEVSPWEWKIEDAKKYKYVQNPGRNSALGLMKVNFINKYSVYLHDTNHRDYFTFTFRSLSSGCVRLEKPLEMAAYLINDEEKWNLKKIQDTTNINYYKKLINDKKKKIALKNAKLLAKNPLLVIPEKTFATPELKTIVIPIKEDILIHQLYWTAWMNKGILQFRDDIYCLDSDLHNRLRN